MVSSIERLHCTSLLTNQSSEPTLLTEDIPTLDRCNRVSIGVLTGWARKERRREVEEIRGKEAVEETEGSRKREGRDQRKGGEGMTYVRM